MREIVGVIIFIFAVSVFAQTAQPSQTPGLMSGSMTNNPNGNRALPLTPTQAAPTANSTMGPGGRPDIDLAPSTRGTLNTLPPNVIASGDATSPWDPYNRTRQRTMNGAPMEPTLPNTTSPLPNSPGF